MNLNQENIVFNFEQRLL